MEGRDFESPTTAVKYALDVESWQSHRLCGNSSQVDGSRSHLDVGVATRQLSKAICASLHNLTCMCVFR